MSAIEQAILGSRKLESILVSHYGAKGQGLHEKISSVEHKLPSGVLRSLRRVATIRNRVVHEHGYQLTNPSEFTATCKALASRLSPQAHQGKKRKRNTAGVAPPKRQQRKKRRNTRKLATGPKRSPAMQVSRSIGSLEGRVGYGRTARTVLIMLTIVVTAIFVIPMILPLFFMLMATDRSAQSQEDFAAQTGSADNKVVHSFSQTKPTTKRIAGAATPPRPFPGHLHVSTRPPQESVPVRDKAQGRHPAAATKLPHDAPVKAQGRINSLGATSWHRPRVHQVQALLQTHGYAPGEIDGILGPRTSSAIKAFQRHQGLPANGKVTPELLNALDGAKPSSRTNERTHPASPTARKRASAALERRP